MFRREKRSEAVARGLHRLILDGEVGPEELLPPEAVLAARSGVSLRVVREALQSLAAKGLVELRQGRRARVRGAHAEMLSEALYLAIRRNDGTDAHLMEVRQPLETEIARLAAQRATDAELEAMAHALREMDRLGPLIDRHPPGESEFMREFNQLDLEFHHLLAVASHNPVMLQLIEALAGLLRMTRARTIWSAVHLGDGTGRNREGHWAVYDAVRRRDRVGAGRAMLEHLCVVQADLRAADAHAEQSGVPADEPPDRAP